MQMTMPQEETLSHSEPISIWKTWKEAINASMPVAMGYLPAAMAFGVLSSAANIPSWISIVISIIVFSGAAQYAAIQPIAAGVSIFDLAINTFAINLRHIFYALPLLDALPKSKLKRTYCLFCLTDEAFSVMTTLPKDKQRSLFLKISVLVHSYWIIGTILGVLAGHKLGNLIPNLDFALTALFVILWYEQWKQKKMLFPTLIAIPAFLLAYLLFPKILLIMALTLAITGIFAHYLSSKKAQ